VELDSVRENGGPPKIYQVTFPLNLSNRPESGQCQRKGGTSQNVSGNIPFKNYTTDHMVVSVKKTGTFLYVLG
jgi:hypothetical protein